MPAIHVSVRTVPLAIDPETGRRNFTVSLDERPASEIRGLIQAIRNRLLREGIDYIQSSASVSVRFRSRPRST